MTDLRYPACTCCGYTAKWSTWTTAYRGDVRHMAMFGCPCRWNCDLDTPENRQILPTYYPITSPDPELIQSFGLSSPHCKPQPPQDLL